MEKKMNRLKIGFEKKINESEKFLQDVKRRNIQKNLLIDKPDFKQNFQEAGFILEQNIGTSLKHNQIIELVFKDFVERNGEKND
tara:strand:- start:241 stop:492 length:252 start_codon:yes stop_codon:yes gene_type:complete